MPLPVAAKYAPFGPFHSADVITQLVPNARPLQEALEGRTLAVSRWQSIRPHVRNLHDHGVFHSDLNLRKFLLDPEDKVWFTDFDKCCRRAPGMWARANLKRLQRSLLKTMANAPDVQWHERDWADLVAGYEGRVS